MGLKPLAFIAALGRGRASLLKPHWLLLLILLASGVIASIWKWSAPCDISVGQKFTSPSGRLWAVVYEKQCGATVPFNTQVGIAPANELFFPDDTLPFLVLEGRHDLRVAWLENNVVEIHIPDGARLYRQEVESAGVRVRYQ